MFLWLNQEEERRPDIWSHAGVPPLFPPKVQMLFWPCLQLGREGACHSLLPRVARFCSPQTEHLKKGHELLAYVPLTVLGVVHRLRGITAGSRNQRLEPGLTAPGFSFLFSFTRLPVTLSLRSLCLWKGFSRVLGRCGLTPQGWISTTWTELRFSNSLLKEKPLLVFRGSHDHPWATYHILRSEWGTLIGQALLTFP